MAKRQHGANRVLEGARRGRIRSVACSYLSAAAFRREDIRSIGDQSSRYFYFVDLES